MERGVAAMIANKDKVMTDSEAEFFVLDLLREHGAMTTMELEVLAHEHNRRCPDQTVLFLTKMKMKGLLTGTVSIERKGWVWSLVDK